MRKTTKVLALLLALTNIAILAASTTPQAKKTPAKTQITTTRLTYEQPISLQNALQDTAKILDKNIETSVILSSSLLVVYWYNSGYRYPYPMITFKICDLS